MYSGTHLMCTLRTVAVALPVLSTPSSDAVKDVAASVPSPDDDNDQLVFDSELNAATRSHQISTMCVVCSFFAVTVMLALL